MPKGLSVVAGSRIVDRVTRALRAVTTDIVLAANDADASTWTPGIRVLRDIHESAGGLAGIEAALSLGRNAIVVAWDMPFVTADLLQVIAEAAARESADAVVPRSMGPIGFEPFCAFYAVSAAPQLSAFLERGGRAAHEFIGQLQQPRFVEDETILRLGDPARFFFSVNTPADLERANAMADMTR